MLGCCPGPNTGVPGGVPLPVGHCPWRKGIYYPRQWNDSCPQMDRLFIDRYSNTGDQIGECGMLNKEFCIRGGWAPPAGDVGSLNMSDIN